MEHQTDHDVRPVAIVTGSGSGIGRAIAIDLGRSGYDVVATGRNESSLAGTRQHVTETGADCLAVPADVSRREDRERLIDATLERFARIDVLVNNAAVTGKPAVAAAIDQEIEHFEYVIAVNLTAAFALSQTVARHMVGRGSGAIVNISSVGAHAAQEYASAYCASKAGLEGLTRSLALEWAPYGIRVNAVAPGDIETETSKNIVEDVSSTAATGDYFRKTPAGRRGRPDEIAKVVTFLTTDDASFMTGESVRVDGGFLIY